MSVRWIGGLTFVWILCTIVSLVIEGAWVGTEEIDILNSLTGYSVIDVGGITGIFKMSFGFLTHGLPKLISWNYAFFTGHFVILRIVCCCFSGAVIWGFIQILLPTMQGLISKFVR